MGNINKIGKSTVPRTAISDSRTPKTASESRYGSSLRKTWVMSVS